MFFPSLSFSCDLAIERWRIEVVEAEVGDSVEAEVGDSVSPIRRRVDRGCIHCNL